MPTTRVKLYLMRRALRNFRAIHRNRGLKIAVTNIFYPFSKKFNKKYNT